MTELERIKNIVTPIAQKHGVEKVWLFGSRARGDARPDSDYDFLISKGRIRTLFEHMDFVDDLEAAFGTHVDVVTDGPGDMEFLEMIRKDEVCIYG